MFFLHVLMSNNKADNEWREVHREVGEVTDDKERKSVIKEALYHLFETSNARKSVVDNGCIPLEYFHSAGLYKVTGMRYILEQSDLQMMSRLLKKPANQRLLFPDNIGSVEKEEREQVILIIAKQAESFGHEQANPAVAAK